MAPRKSTSTPSAPAADDVFEELGRGIALLVKDELGKTNAAVGVVDGKVDDLATSVGTLRVEVEQLAARPLLSRSSVQAMLTGFRDGLK